MPPAVVCRRSVGSVQRVRNEFGGDDGGLVGPLGLVGVGEQAVDELLCALDGEGRAELRGQRQ